MDKIRCESFTLHAPFPNFAVYCQQEWAPAVDEACVGATLHIPYDFGVGIDECRGLCSHAIIASGDWVDTFLGNVTVGILAASLTKLRGSIIGTRSTTIWLPIFAACFYACACAFWFTQEGHFIQAFLA
jgi:hypothetical protein